LIISNIKLKINKDEVKMENEKRVLRLGGLAGILAFIIWIGEMPLYGYVDPFTYEGLMRFPDVRVALGISTILMMTIAFLSVTLVLAMYRVLRETNLAFALFGGVMGIIGYITTALGDASTFFAFAPISDLYQGPAATPETQEVINLLWQTNRGMTNTFFFVGSLFMTICFIVLGVAMINAPAFGKRLGLVSIVLGVIGIAGVISSLFVAGDIGMQLMGISVFSNLIFLPLFGWKVYKLSRGPRSPKI
jgi:hypothetical protein